MSEKTQNLTLLFMAGVLSGGCLILYLLSERNYENIVALEDARKGMERKDETIHDLREEVAELKRNKGKNNGR